ncbi:MAG: hypothetical protein J0I62_07990 [Microbacterium sp.]|nr:hypothetical protein [Microbacterium sp.]
MTLRPLLQEAWRNLLTGTSRAALLTVLLSVLSAGLAALEVISVQQISAAARTYVSSAASVVTLTAPGRISGVACDALDALPGVRAAGALRPRTSPLTAIELPSSPLPVTDITGGVLQLLRADHGSAEGVVLSREAADLLGVRSGGRLHTPQGGIPITGVYEYPSDGRDPGYGYAVLAPVTPAGAFDACWADIRPQSKTTALVMRTVLLPDGPSDDPPQLGQLNSTLGAAFDGAQRFHDRLTRFAALLALALAAGIGFVSVRIRRLELASALHAGVGKGALGAMLAVETVAWTVPAAVLTATTVTVLLAVGPPIDGTTGWILGARVGFAAVVGPFLGGLLALLRTSERQLFRYFRDR